MSVVFYLTALTVGILLTLAINIIYPHGQKVINDNRVGGRMQWGGVGRSVVSDWRQAKPALVLALVCLVLVVGLTVWQSLVPSDIDRLSEKIDTLSTKIDKQTESINNLILEMQNGESK